jgi:uncharacterized protein YndB with AHSA1/START domain
MVDVELLTALAEPNRLRILELLGTAPRAVGEIAAALELRQPQATKHLQALERAGLVAVHPLGRRRIYALRRGPLRELRAWLDGFDADHPSEGVLVEYEPAIERERAGDRTIRLTKLLPAPPRTVWTYWTSARAIRRWWHPDHFRVAECRANAVPGGALRIVLEEGDGTRYPAIGRYLELEPPRRLVFELSPGGFAATHRVALHANGRRTRLSLTIRVTDVTPAAIPAVAGIEIGWRQLLDNLRRALS